MSKVSASSSSRSCGSAAEHLNRIQVSSCNSSCPPQDDEDAENIDLWTVWGNLIKSWESEMKRKPNCVKV